MYRIASLEPFSRRFVVSAATDTLRFAPDILGLFAHPVQFLIQLRDLNLILFVRGFEIRHALRNVRQLVDLSFHFGVELRLQSTIGLLGRSACLRTHGFDAGAQILA